MIISRLFNLIKDEKNISGIKIILFLYLSQLNGFNINEEVNNKLLFYNLLMKLNAFIN